MCVRKVDNMFECWVNFDGWKVIVYVLCFMVGGFCMVVIDFEVIVDFMIEVIEFGYCIGWLLFLIFVNGEVLVCCLIEL